MTGAFPWAGAAAVAAGAAIGALLRWGAALWLNGVWHGFPLGTWAVNALGGLAIGALLVFFEQTHAPVWRLFLITGLLGGFTTFSAFSAESLGLLQRGQWGWALAHTLAHVLGSLGCAAAGYALVNASLRA